MQAAFSLSRKVVNVQEPAGKGPVLSEEAEDGDAAAELL